ncbi:hypothetical protein JOB18_018373 [Solea senegalensis]|uniref:Uncharacterized protein n=1 Tax=Solea senegalensis TaxID=28829 RepID=A0AAV6QLF0_SOLSE|nr:hypothetical protein JOB18_018373 [Solea senegalensis]
MRQRILASPSSYPPLLFLLSRRRQPLSSCCGDKTQRLVRPDQCDSYNAVQERGPLQPSVAKRPGTAASLSSSTRAEVTLTKNPDTTIEQQSAHLSHVSEDEQGLK